MLVAEGGNGPASGLGERLADLGCFVLPAAASAADALALLGTFRPDAALLGAGLPGGPAVVAAALDAADVPFALVTVPGGHGPTIRCSARRPASAGSPGWGNSAGSCWGSSAGGTMEGEAQAAGETAGASPPPRAPRPSPPLAITPVRRAAA